MNDKLGKKPLTPDGELLELLKEWVAPDVTESKQVEYVGKTNFLGMPLEELYSKVVKEEEPEEEEIPPLTAEEIEQIRQDAYDEGFELGKTEGYQAGEQEGLAKGHELGLKSGHEQGYFAGLQQGQFEITQKASRFSELAEQLYAPIKKVDEAAEQQLLNLVVMLTESVIRHESKSNKDALLSVLHEAMSSLPFNDAVVEIHVHPSDAKLLSETYSEETLIENKWLIKEEPSYQTGDVIVMTPNSLIDRSIKQRIKQSLDVFVEKAGLDQELNKKTEQELETNENDINLVQQNKDADSDSSSSDSNEQ